MNDINTDTTLYVTAQDGTVLLKTLVSDGDGIMTDITIKLSPEAAYRLAQDMLGKWAAAAMQVRVKELQAKGKLP
jgi:hypothetical protein